MIFGGMQRNSSIDFPGVLSCVLFTTGCNLDCFYCHNRNLLSHTDKSANIEEQSVMEFLHRRIGLLDGVVISGGEPTLQKDLPEFIVKIKQMGYKVKLDTNGQNPEMLRKIIGNTKTRPDYVAVDLKSTQEGYPAVCKTKENGWQKTIESIKLLFDKVPFEVRTTIYPGMTMGDLKNILTDLPKLPKWRINHFVMPKEYSPKDLCKFEMPLLSQGNIKETLPELLSLQPNLIA